MIITVVVTYHPGDPSALPAELTGQCDSVIVVDSGSDPVEVEALRRIRDQAGVALLELGENPGITVAQNCDIELAQSRAVESPESNFVLLSDQGSIPAPNMVARLLEATEEDPVIMAVGPLPSEEREGVDELVYVDRGWTPKRVSRSGFDLSCLDVAFLVASGCLIRLPVLASMGKTREDLFIDHVDLEWGVRAGKAS